MYIYIHSICCCRAGVVEVEHRKEINKDTTSVREARIRHTTECWWSGSWLPGVQYVLPVLPVPAVVLNAEGISRVKKG